MAEIAGSSSREEILKESGPPAILGQGPNVWIIGSSYIRRGEERARHTMGSNLGLNCRVWWFGKGGLRWRNLLPFFYQSLRGRTVPDVLLIHGGGNDLGNIKGVELVTAMKQDLLSLSDNFSEMKIILSSINERCHWRKANPGKLNKARMWVNREMGKCVSGLGGESVRHPCIKFDCPGIFLRDGVHFTNLGNDVFLSNLKQSLEATI
ncbi:uncharacterized protein LOC117540514 [Gymnodraco acuticeps]|uniref:Uncharacterized protein LOC117540514 n=1 Tax=Gymnodraco acuticeps TaxID=8218 RepID=A0A6P8U8F1_GYMAC|nr:uncharacterized protein LOC117540514 [Gymnodraco acuticeps]